MRPKLSLLALVTELFFFLSFFFLFFPLNIIKISGNTLLHPSAKMSGTCALKESQKCSPPTRFLSSFQKGLFLLFFLLLLLLLFFLLFFHRLLLYLLLVLLLFLLLFHLLLLCIIIIIIIIIITLRYLLPNK